LKNGTGRRASSSWRAIIITVALLFHLCGAASIMAITPFPSTIDEAQHVSYSTGRRHIDFKCLSRTAAVSSSDASAREISLVLLRCQNVSVVTVP
jgi:hypothetical protein